MTTLVKRATGVTYALKTMPSDLELHGGDSAAAFASLLRDVRMQSELTHPSIRPSSTSSSTRRAHSVVCHGTGCRRVGALLARHPGVPEVGKARIIRQMLLAVGYCHEARRRPSRHQAGEFRLCVGGARRARCSS